MVMELISGGNSAQGERCSFSPLRDWLLRKCLLFLGLWRDDFEGSFLETPLVAILWPFVLLKRPLLLICGLETHGHIGGSWQSPDVS